MSALHYFLEADELTFLPFCFLFSSCFWMVHTIPHTEKKCFKDKCDNYIHNNLKDKTNIMSALQYFLEADELTFLLFCFLFSSCFWMVHTIPHTEKKCFKDRCDNYIHNNLKDKTDTMSVLHYFLEADELTFLPFCFLFSPCFWMVHTIPHTENKCFKDKCDNYIHNNLKDKTKQK